VKFVFAHVSLLFVLLALVACREQDALREMARVDRVLIPALALTSEGQLTERTVMAVKTLKVDWPLFEHEARGGPWEEALMSARDMVFQADARIDRHEPLLAHQALEAVRGTLYEGRRRAGVQYFPDRLVAFHKVLQSMMGVVRGKAPADLTEGDVRRLAELLGEAEAHWQQAEGAEFTPEVYGFSEEKAGLLAERMQRVRRALASCGTALRAGDPDSILTYVLRLRAPFEEVYFLFGDFEGLAL
jgi:hypothetical protein